MPAVQITFAINSCCNPMLTQELVKHQLNLTIPHIIQQSSCAGTPPIQQNPIHPWLTLNPKNTCFPKTADVDVDANVDAASLLGAWSENLLMGNITPSRDAQK